MESGGRGATEDTEQVRRLWKREHDSERAGRRCRGWETVKMKNSDWTRQCRGQSHFREPFWGLDRG